MHLARIAAYIDVTPNKDEMTPWLIYALRANLKQYIKRTPFATYIHISTNTASTATHLNLKPVASDASS